jgi:hypothetical protein
VYGRGKCRDLLSLEREFEQLRVKLYPSSSTAPEMNEVVGRWYGDAIRRGDPRLYAEMLRVLAGNDQPTLSQWKTAAVKAVHIQEITSTSLRATGGTRSAFWRNQGQARTPTAPVNAAGGGAGEEGETEDLDTEAAQQIEGRVRSGRGPRGPLLLSTDEFRTVMEKKLCLQCYKPGHRRGDDTCPEKGQKRRRPAPGELTKV